MTSMSLMIRYHRPPYVPTDMRESSKLASMDQKWSIRGDGFQKVVYIRREGKKSVPRSKRVVLTAIDKMFGNIDGEYYNQINYEDKEFRPMGVSRRGRRCEVCGAKPQRGKPRCKGCDALSPEARIIVKKIDPVLHISIDERWRWITGHMYLVAHLKE